jgi:hypothetical protein
MNEAQMHVEHLKKLIPEAKRELATNGDYWMGHFTCGILSTGGQWRSAWIAGLEDTLAVEEAKLSIQ